MPISSQYKARIFEQKPSTYHVFVFIFHCLYQVFAVGVGSGVDKTELNAIATDPDSSHVLTVQNFQQLSKITATLNNQACKGMCTWLKKQQKSPHRKQF